MSLVDSMKKGLKEDYFYDQHSKCEFHEIQFVNNNQPFYTINMNIYDDYDKLCVNLKDECTARIINDKSAFIGFLDDVLKNPHTYRTYI